MLERGEASEAGARGRLRAVTFAGATVHAVIVTPAGREIAADVPTHHWQDLAIQHGAWATGIRA